MKSSMTIGMWSLFTTGQMRSTEVWTLTSYAPTALRARWGTACVITEDCYCGYTTYTGMKNGRLQNQPTLLFVLRSLGFGVNVSVQRYFLLGIYNSSNFHLWMQKLKLDLIGEGSAIWKRDSTPGTTCLVSTEKVEMLNDLGYTSMSCLNLLFGRLRLVKERPRTAATQSMT